jgi:hypothetical protein
MNLRKGELVKKVHLPVVLAIGCLFVLAVSGFAQDGEGVVVKVPFEFVAGAKTMPAGMYSVRRVSFDSHSGLIIRSENESALLLPIVVDRTSAGQATISFERQGDRYILSRLATPGGVYTIAMPRATTTQAHMKEHGSVSFSGAT